MSDAFDFQDRGASLSSDEVRVIRWSELSGEQRSAAWHRLAVFVDWLVGRYSLPELLVPPCWYRHGGLVEELTALMTAHEVSFDELDSGLGPIGWHERFAMARLRLQELYRGECQTGHIDPRTRAGISDSAAFCNFVDDDCETTPDSSTA